MSSCKKFEWPPYHQLYSDPSGMAGCLSHDRGGTNIKLEHRFTLNYCCAVLQDQSLFLSCHCQSVAPHSQTLSMATLSQVHQMDALPPSNTSVLSCAHLALTQTLHLVSSSVILNHYTHSLIVLSKDTPVMVMPLPKSHSSLGVFKGMTKKYYNSGALSNHLADPNHW